jgi:hypothetical protein
MRFIAVFILTCFLVTPALADGRIALVVGNSAYRNSPSLPNPHNDAEDVAASLRRSGFEVILGIDLTKADMDEAAIKFSRAAHTADVAMVYYSGHAVQYAGSNYLVPIDASLTDLADLRRTLSVNDLVADLQQATVGIIILDACRDNPLADSLRRSITASRGISVPRGLARIDAPTGMVIAYATQVGHTASDGNGRNSPYTSAFLKHIEEPEEAGIVFRRIGAEVYEATHREQLPELSLSLTGDLYLSGKSPQSKEISRPIDNPCSAAPYHWKSAESIGTVAAFEDHMARFPNCPFVGLAQERIQRLNNIASSNAGTVPTTPSPQRVEEESAWARLQSSKSRKSLRDFIDRFPASSHRAEAEGLIAALTPSTVKPKATPNLDRRVRVEPTEKKERKDNQRAAFTCSGQNSRCEATCAGKPNPRGCVARFCVPTRRQCMASGCWHGLQFNKCGGARI